MARGFGCLFGLFFLLGLAGLVGLVASVAGAVGPLAALARVLGLVILVAAIVTLVAAGRTFRRVAVSLDELVEAADRVEAGDYTTRVTEPGRGPRPMRNLARGFNEMVARLEIDETQRRRLLADVSHELRTPLAVVQGNIEAMLDGVHEADEAHLAAILEETRVLGRLVDDLRTVALSESGSLSLHREPTDLSVVATDAVGAFRSAAQAAGVNLGVEIADDIPLLEVDPVRIREVISNLVANALRHTPAGGSVTVVAHVEEARRSDRAVAVTVRDTGSGIEPELLAHVFDRFAKGAGSRGSGLGLAIARGLVEAHGGSIDVESAPGRGSTFRFRLPLAAEAG
ncbi:MAG TPA: ATP-binding protein [Candidatus Limnocylindrales bacterium]|nr:ATP-binding protein [Candidatus Limnocylindrales bacterium]